MLFALSLLYCMCSTPFLSPPTRTVRVFPCYIHKTYLWSYCPPPTTCNLLLIIIYTAPSSVLPLHLRSSVPIPPTPTHAVFLPFPDHESVLSNPSIVHSCHSPQTHIITTSMEYPQPFDNRPRRFRYVPRAGERGAIYPVDGAAPLPVLPAGQPLPVRYPAAVYQCPSYSYSYAAQAYPAPQYQYYYPTAPPTPTAYAVPLTAGYTPQYATQYQYSPQPAAYYRYDQAPVSYGAVVYGQTRGEVELSNRRLATERGAYYPRAIMPVANPDDIFWVLERDGQWMVRSFYNIQTECHPGRWKMDAKDGYCVFIRE